MEDTSVSQINNMHLQRPSDPAKLHPNQCSFIFPSCPWGLQLCKRLQLSSYAGQRLHYIKCSPLFSNWLPKAIQITKVLAKVHKLQHFAFRITQPPQSEPYALNKRRVGFHFVNNKSCRPSNSASKTAPGYLPISRGTSPALSKLLKVAKAKMAARPTQGVLS